MNDPSTIESVIGILKDQIARDQVYINTLGGAIAAMGIFFGLKWLGGMKENTLASADQAATNRELTTAVKALTEAVVHGKKE